MELRSILALTKKTNSLSLFYNSNWRTITDFDKTQNMIYRNIKEIIRLSKLTKSYITYEPSIRRLDTLIEHSITATNNVTNAVTIEELKEGIKALCDYINDNSNSISYIDSSDIMSEKRHLRSNLSVLQKDLNLDLFNKIASKINFSNKDNIMIFDPQCNNGLNLNAFISCFPTTRNQTYGLDNNSYDAEMAKETLTRVIKGGLKGSVISNGVFDICFINPRIDVAVYESSYRTEKEKAGPHIALIKNSLKFIKQDGLAVIILPYYELSPDLKLYLSKWLNDIKFIKVNDYVNTEEHADLKRICIMGRYKFNPNYSDTYLQLNMLDYDNFLLEPKECEYVIPADPGLELKLFRGSVLDPEELNDIVATDGLMDDFFNATEIKHSLEDTQPLLPFNIGQIGLILSSGCLDGIVEEGNGVKHIIKGMTIKESNTVTETSLNNKGETIINATETVSNKVQISAFGADGTFYTLI